MVLVHEHLAPLYLSYCEADHKDSEQSTAVPSGTQNVENRKEEPRTRCPSKDKGIMPLVTNFLHLDTTF